MTLKNKKVLITCGPTWIPIDSTRIISNTSTGRMGHQIAKDFAKAQAKVSLLEGPIKETLESKTVCVKKFCYYDEFFLLLKNELKKKYDIIIHAAAVSDYKLEKPFKAKLGSGKKNLKLNLVPTKKPINLIKKLSPDSYLVGFKLESNLTKTLANKKSEGLFQKANCDLVVANYSKGNKYSGYILNRNKNILAHETSRQGISRGLIKILKQTI